MTNISYILLVLISVFVAIITVAILYWCDFFIISFKMFVILYFVICLMLYFFLLRLFHSIGYKVFFGGVIYLLVLSFFPQTIGLFEAIEFVVSEFFTYAGWSDYERDFFLDTYQINIYIVIASGMALSSTWFFDAVLIVVLKRIVYWLKSNARIIKT